MKGLRLAAAVLCALLRRRLRGVTCFVTLVYLANVYIYSMTFAYERYNASLMSLRFILVGLALAQLQALLRGGHCKPPDSLLAGPGPVKR